MEKTTHFAQISALISQNCQTIQMLTEAYCSERSQSFDHQDAPRSKRSCKTRRLFASRKINQRPGTKEFPEQNYHSERISGDQLACGKNGLAGIEDQLVCGRNGLAGIEDQLVCGRNGLAGIEEQLVCGQNGLSNGENEYSFESASEGNHGDQMACGSNGLSNQEVNHPYDDIHAQRPSIVVVRPKDQGQKNTATLPYVELDDEHLRRYII